MFQGKQIYDITRPISNEITVWPGDGGVCLKRNLSMSKGAMCNVSWAGMGVHTGTHMDAPLHFIDGGADIASAPMDRLIGEVVVIETNAELIEVSDIRETSLQGVNAVFFKTRCSSLDEKAPFLEHYPAISAECAQYLIESGIKTVGTDYFSIECCTDNTFPVHKKLLSHGVSIVENLCMKEVEPGRYSFACLPLKLLGSDGSPCRALLFR